MTDYEKIYNNVKNLMSIYIPKLETISNGGNSSTIHESNRLLLLIKSYYENAEYWHKVKDKRELSSIVTCEEYIKTAVMWMEKIAHG